MVLNRRTDSPTTYATAFGGGSKTVTVTIPDDCSKLFYYIYGAFASNGNSYTAKGEITVKIDGVNHKRSYSEGTNGWPNGTMRQYYFTETLDVTPGQEITFYKNNASPAQNVGSGVIYCLY